MGIWVESLKRAGILLLQWEGENFASRQHLKFCHFQPVHCVSKNPIAPKLFNRFSKSLPQLEDVEDGHLGGKFQVRRYITFEIARWNLCASTTFEILPLSICTLSQQKSYISQGVQPIFEIFASARSKMLTVGICLENHRCADTVLLQWQGENFAHVQHLKYPTVNLYTVAGKILYLQRYSTDFRNLNLSWKMLRVGISVESFRCADIVLLQWQGEYFAHWQHLKLRHFQPAPCASKNPLSPKVFNRFSKSLPQLEDVEVGIGAKLQVSRYFTLTMARWNRCASTTFEILRISTCTLCQQKSYISTGIQPIFKMFGTARRFWGWAFG